MMVVGIMASRRVGLGIASFLFVAGLVRCQQEGESTAGNEFGLISLNFVSDFSRMSLQLTVIHLTYHVSS